MLLLSGTPLAVTTVTVVSLQRPQSSNRLSAFNRRKNTNEFWKFWCTRGSFPAAMSSESLFLYFFRPSWNIFHLAARMHWAFMARWNCKHPWMLISKSILFWIAGGKRAPVNNNTLLRVLLETFAERPELVFWRDCEDVRFVLDGQMSAVKGDACSVCPWTSLACVLINSLLVIPSGVACWDPSPVPPPHSSRSQACSLSFSFPPRGLWTSLWLQSFHRSFLFLLLKVKRWLHAHVCPDETETAETIKLLLPIINPRFLCHCGGWKCDFVVLRRIFCPSALKSIVAAKSTFRVNPLKWPSTV